MQIFYELTVKTKGQGLYNFTKETTDWVKKQKIHNGILNINSNLRPILIDNLLFTISQKGYLIVIDIVEGKIIRSNYILDKFKAKERKKLFMQGFLIASDKVYITTNLGYLIICSVSTGKVEKVSELSSSQLSEPIISNNHLYVATNKSLFISN